MRSERFAFAGRIQVIDDHEGMTGDPAAWARELQQHVLATKKLCESRPDHVLTARQYASAKKKMLALAGEGLESHPPGAKGKSAITTNARALANRLIDRADQYLLYAVDPEVPFTGYVRRKRSLRFARRRRRRTGQGAATPQWVLPLPRGGPPARPHPQLP